MRKLCIIILIPPLLSETLVLFTVLLTELVPLNLLSVYCDSPPALFNFENAWCSSSFKVLGFSIFSVSELLYILVPGGK